MRTERDQSANKNRTKLAAVVVVVVVAVPAKFAYKASSMLSSSSSLRRCRICVVVGNVLHMVMGAHARALMSNTLAHTHIPAHTSTNTHKHFAAVRRRRFPGCWLVVRCDLAGARSVKVCRVWESASAAVRGWGWDWNSTQVHKRHEWKCVCARLCESCAVWCVQTFAAHSWHDSSIPFHIAAQTR